MPTPTLVDLLAADGVTVKGTGNNWLGLCPFHDDKTSSFNVDPEKGVYFCHGCGAKGNAYQYLTRKRDLTPAEAKAILGESQPRPAADAKPPTVYSSLPRRRIATHEYRDADGTLILAVCRYADLPAGATKEERRKWRKVDQWTPVDGGWIAKRPKRRTHQLYRLPELLAAPGDKQVMVVEGEKCADTVAAAFPRAIVTTWLGGSSVADTRIDTIDLEPLYGRPVLLVSDTDETGRAAMRAVAARLGPHCPKVRLVLPPGDGGADIHDWITNDGVRQAMDVLARLAQDAPKPTPPAAPPPPSSDGWIDGFTKSGLTQALDHLGIEIRFNVRSDMMEILRDGAWIASDRLEQADLRELIQSRCRIPLAKGEKPALFNKEHWERCRDAMLRDRRVDPFIEWVEAMPDWDRTPRLDGLIHTLWGVASYEQDELARWASRYPFLGALQRAYEPGAKIDEFPILVGEEDAGKSVFIKHILPLDSTWFGENVDLSSDAKDLVEQLQGLAIAEIGEMAGLRRAEVEDVKRTITRAVDMVRLSWRPDPARFPRRSIFVGTANPTGVIVPSDLSGNRRFVPIVLGADRCLVGRPEDYLSERRDQLWAEAVHAYRAGVRANLSRDLVKRARESAESHRVGNEELENAFELANDVLVAQREAVIMKDIIEAVLRENRDIKFDARKNLEMEVGKLLTRAKWTRGRHQINGKQKRSWLPPQRLSPSPGTAPAPPPPLTPVARELFDGDGDDGF